MTTGYLARQAKGGIVDIVVTAPPSGVGPRASAAAPPTDGTPLTVAAPTGNIPEGTMMGGGGGGGGGGVLAVAAAAIREGESSCCRRSAPPPPAPTAGRYTKRLGAAAGTVVTPTTVGSVAAGAVGAAAHHRLGRHWTHRWWPTSRLLLMVAAVIAADPHTRPVRQSAAAAVGLTLRYGLPTRPGRHPRRRQRRCALRSGGWPRRRHRGHRRRPHPCGHGRCHPAVRAPLVPPYSPRAHPRPLCHRHHRHSRADGRRLASSGLWCLRRR